VRAAKRDGDPLLDKEDSLMARLPLSGDIGIFIVDAEYNALQARSISDAERYAREKAWACLAACKTSPAGRTPTSPLPDPSWAPASQGTSTPPTSSPPRTSRPAGASTTRSRWARGR
jgi:hypothetical protein